MHTNHVTAEITTFKLIQLSKMLDAQVSYLPPVTKSNWHTALSSSDEIRKLDIQESQIFPGSPSESRFTHCKNTSTYLLWE